MDICEKRKMYLDRESVNGGKVYLEKKDFIIENQKKRLAETEKNLEEVTMKLDDVEKLVDEITLNKKLYNEIKILGAGRILQGAVQVR